MRALILTNVHLGKRMRLLDKLKVLSRMREIEGIKYSFATTGMFDIILMAIFDDLKQLFSLVKEVYKIEEVSSTETQVELPLNIDSYDPYLAELKFDEFAEFKGIKGISFLKIEKPSPEIMDSLCSIEGVIDAFVMLGRFDVATLITSNDLSSLKNIINKIHWTKGVKREETMIEI